MSAHICFIYNQGKKRGIALQLSAYTKDLNIPGRDVLLGLFICPLQMKAFDVCKQLDRFGPFPALELPLCASCKDGNDPFPVIGFEVVCVVDDMVLLLLVLHYQACWLGLAFIADLQAVDIAVMKERERKADQREFVCN